jgi:hypothetical protein
MNKTPLAIVLMATLSACGGGGSSSDNGGAKASLTFTPVHDVAALVGTQSATLNATRAATSWSPITAAYADEVSTTVELVATDVGGNQFKTNFLDEEGNPASETVTPTGLVRLDDDHAMVELFVMTNKATNLHEYRHYVVEYSTGKMILVETLKSIGNAWSLNAQYYAAGPNSLHNATNEIIYRKEDTKWYKVTLNWADLTFTETEYADSTGWADQDMVSTLPTANGDLFTVAGGALSLNGTDLGLQYVTSVFQKDGRVYASTANKLYDITSGTPVEYASLPEGNISIDPVVAFDGATIYTSSCTSLSVNGSSLAYSYIPVDRDTVGYEVIMAGREMMCAGHPRVTETEAVTDNEPAMASVRATATNDFTGTDAACDLIERWKQLGGDQLVLVSNGVEKRVTGAEGVYKILPMSRDTAYVSQTSCTLTGGDGVSAAKWSAVGLDSKVDFSTGELSALSAPVVMSIVN